MRVGRRAEKMALDFGRIVVNPIRDPNGKLVGYAKITRDLSERRRAEEQLRQSQEQFRLLVQGVTDYALYMLDLEGRVSSWNAALSASRAIRGTRSLGTTSHVSIRRRSGRRGSP